MVAPAFKKRVPNSNELVFIEVARNILTGQISDIKERAAAVNGSWREIATELYTSYQEGGASDFWASYDAIANDRPQLKDWRPSVAVSPEQSDQTEEEPIGILLSDVNPKPIHWMWNGRLALGKMEMFDGPPDLGKTTLMLDIIARLTRGRPMPFEPAPGMQGGAVLICLEDDIEDTIQPKLAKAGADLSKIVSIGFRKETMANGLVCDRAFNLAEDIDILEAAIKRVDAKLIFIDPIMAILGGKDTYKDNEVRSTLAPLTALANRYGATVVCIRHTTKGSNGEKLIHQGIGSIGFIGLARIGLMAIENPDNENQAIFFTPKNNLIKKELRTKLLYTIVSDADDPNRPYVRWDGVTTITDQELTSKPTETQGEIRQSILRILKEHYPDPMSPQQVADELGTPDKVESITVTLGRMQKIDQIEKSSRGQYAAHSGVS